MKWGTEMNRLTENPGVTTADIAIALSEIFAEQNYDGIPVADQRDAVEAFHAFEDGGLAEAPNAFSAYMTSQRSQYC